MLKEDFLDALLTSHQKDFTGYHLANFDMGHEHMQGLKFDRACLEGFKCGESDFTGTTFNRAFMTRAMLRDACLFKTHFIHTLIDHAILIGSNLTGAICIGADLSGSKLQSTTLEDTVFDHAILRNANLEEAQLTRTRFMCADLSGASLEGAILKDVEFTPYMRAEGTRWVGATFNGEEIIDPPIFVSLYPLPDYLTMWPTSKGKLFYRPATERDNAALMTLAEIRLWINETIFDNFRRMVILSRLDIAVQM